VIPNGWHKLGETGADAYLAHYGKSIGAPKVIALGLNAWQEGYLPMAEGFFKKAAVLEGVVLDGGNGNVALPEIDMKKLKDDIASVIAKSHPLFPEHIQPGKFAPMQPSDTTKDRNDFIVDPHYWGQPKIDGVKMIAFATAQGVYYQSRQGKLNNAPDPRLDAALKASAGKVGVFVLEGELTWLDLHGGEHRTAPQAVTANLEQGLETIMPRPRFMVFACPYHRGYYESLTTYGLMVHEGMVIVDAVASEFVQVCPTAKTNSEKLGLVARQKEEGREGEVWFRQDMPYQSGKLKGDVFVRTKYVTEGTARVTGFTPTTAQGFAFGAMKISTLDGRSMGSIGTGFTLEQRHQLLTRFTQDGPFEIDYISQGYTENGMIWHGRVDPQWYEKHAAELPPPPSISLVVQAEMEEWTDE
jgi:bifunctional non-homologous end joining protein LigD